MITHVLDTSAVLAHYLREPGAEDVNAILARGPEEAGVSLISLVEPRSRLAEVAAHAQEAERAFKLYTETLTTVLPFSRETADAAMHLRAATRQRQTTRRDSRPSRSPHGGIPCGADHPTPLAAEATSQQPGEHMKTPHSILWTVAPLARFHRLDNGSHQPMKTGTSSSNSTRRNKPCWKVSFAMAKCLR